MRLYTLIALATLLIGCTGENTPDSESSEFDLLSLQWEAEGAVHNGRICELIGSGESIALEPDVVLGLEHFASAHVTHEEATSEYSVEARMTSEGRRRFKEQTSENVGRRLAVVINNEVVALPTVMAPIDTSAVPLMPIASLELADSLADVLNAAILQKARGD